MPRKDEINRDLFESRFLAWHPRFSRVMDQYICQMLDICQVFADSPPNLAHALPQRGIAMFLEHVQVLADLSAALDAAGQAAMGAHYMKTGIANGALSSDDLEAINDFLEFLGNIVEFFAQEAGRATKPTTIPYVVACQDLLASHVNSLGVLAVEFRTFYSAYHFPESGKDTASASGPVTRPHFSDESEELLARLIRVTRVIGGSE